MKKAGILVSPETERADAAIPAFYNDLDLSLNHARSMIAKGAASRRSSFHTPVVATLNKDGSPSQRIMVLRALDWENRRVRFHTDARSHKVAELHFGDSASIIFYDPGIKIQLRLSGRAWTEESNEHVNAAWQNSTEFARRCYMTEKAPGALLSAPSSGLPDWIVGQQPIEEQLQPYRVNFAVLWFEFSQLEWLYLANVGHRRARWIWNKKDWHGSWLVP
jgi:pyridoxamine 5'-phosphate oxidase